MKTIKKLLIIPFVLFTVVACKINSKSQHTSQNKSETSKTPHAFEGNGVNLQPSYYNNGNVNLGWGVMKQYPKIKTIRIEIEPDKVQQARTWILQAHLARYQVIATYHKYTVLGSNDPQELINAAKWWKANYNYIASTENIIINLMNEWGNHLLTVKQYVNAYNEAIAIIREVYDGPIIIDAPGWGQEVSIAAAAVKGTEGVKISDTNIVLSTHIYPQSWNGAKKRFLKRDDIDDLASAGRPCIVGEFGGFGEIGPVNVTDLVGYAREKGWPVIGWAWNGDGGKMNMLKPSWSENPLATSFTKSDYFDKIYDLL